MQLKMISIKMKILYYDKLRRILSQNKLFLFVDYCSYIIFKLHLNIYYENEYKLL